MSGVTKLDRIRNERIRGTTKVGEIVKKVHESRLKWYGHVLRREEASVGKRMMVMEVPGERRRESGGGWRASGTTYWRENNCQGRKHKTGPEEEGHELEMGHTDPTLLVDSELEKHCQKGST